MPTRDKRYYILAVGALLLVLISLSSFFNLRASNSEAVAGRHGMVITAHPLATRLGVEILRKGGNAFDAAVAVAAALCVVESMMFGIGGYGTILIFDAKGKSVWCLNSSGSIPAQLNADVFRDMYPGAEENRRCAAAVSTPGNLYAWETLSHELFVPAIRFAGTMGDPGAFPEAPTTAVAV